MRQMPRRLSSRKLQVSCADDKDTESNHMCDSEKDYAPEQIKALVILLNSRSRL